MGREAFDAVGPRADSVGAETATVSRIHHGYGEVPMVGRERWEQIQRL